jgi:hypothetical protein
MGVVKKASISWLSLTMLLFTAQSVRAAVDIDIIALYSPSAEALFADTPTRIEALFTEANQVHNNSLTGITLNTVLIMPYNGPDTSNINSGALNTMDSDPVLALLKATYGADLVVLFTESSGSLCGLGRVGQGTAVDGISPFEFNRDATSWSTSAIDCDGQTVAHEIGHNFGLSHSEVQGNVGNIVDYGRGFGVNNSFSTIMAYANFFGSAVSLNRFSKWDDNNCLGQPCGIEPGLFSEADAFRAMALVDEDIAGYFPSQIVADSQDTDGDNMPDTWEWENGLNGFIAIDGPQDLDNDGWSNVQEFYAMTEPRNASSFPVPGNGDSDGDGINDPQDEFPFDPNETIDTDADTIGDEADLDDDGDGMDDDFETFHGYNSLNANDAGDDSDADGATNLQEYKSGTDPTSNLSNPETQDVFRVSISTSGSQGVQHSGVPLDVDDNPLTLSRDGRHVAFESDADNLVEGDVNLAKDVFLHDRLSGLTNLVSLANDGTQATSDSYGPAMARDMLTIAFVTETDLVALDTNGLADVYLRDVDNNLTEFVSVSTEGTQGNSNSGSPALSSNGQHVAFHSYANSLVDSDNNGLIRDIFLRNRTGLSTSIVSLSSSGEQGNGSSEKPDISGSGALVAFHTFATSLLLDDTNSGFPDTLIHDTDSQQTTVISVDSNDAQTSGNSFSVAMSEDGRWVAFQSDSFGLVPGITNGNVDVFLRDQILGDTTRVSVSSSGEQANGNSKNASISDNGRYIVFESAASNLVEGDDNGVDDIFMHDTATGNTILISKNLSGEPANGHSRNPKISGDGTAVAFTSYATDLVYWDQNAQADVFVMETGVTLLLDSDNDGVEDDNDNCKDIANVEQLDTDNDGVGDACDAFPLDESETVDTDVDGIGNNADLDDDGDGLPDTYELANGLNPLDAGDAGLDNDLDGLSNFDEFRLGTDINDADTDGDGIDDNVDNNPLVFDDVDPILYSGKVIILPDINADGVKEIGLLRVDIVESKVRLEILNGKDRVSLDEIVWVDNFSDVTLSLHIIPDMNNNGFDEVGLFGIQDIQNNEGKPQMFVRDLKTGNKVGDVYNWVANWKEVSALILDDMTGDGISEIAIQGRFEEGKRPQLVVKTGNTNTILDTYTYPDLLVSPHYYQHSDISGDGVKEIATFGRLLSNNKIQTKIADGMDALTKMPAYNFPDKWDNVSWHRLDDSNGDGQDDWGMFGTFREDGRPQLVNKDGVSPMGALRIFAWPLEMQNAQFFRIPDMNNDGVDEVAAAGQRSNNGRYQFQVQDGTDRNVLLANHNLNLDFESVTYHVLPDLSGDEKAEIGFMGINPQGDYELVIRHGDAANGEYATYNLGSDWQNTPAITSLGDTDDDGLPDLLVYGQNASGNELRLENY